ncbi:MAG TPA: aconitase X catalytic domain-containing protein [Acidimicrobiia bacterium]
MELEVRDKARLAGSEGPGVALAMRVVTGMGEAVGATSLLDVTGAHVDSCLYHGRAGLDFALRLAEGGAMVSVPTTLNITSLDLLHPELYRGDGNEAAAARRQLEAYEAMGCRPTWTCAPYQLEARPGLGEHIAWAESNAIVFANSVLGARTGRYGDFFDICAAVTGRVPAAGLHLDWNRLGGVVLSVEPRRWDMSTSLFYAALGHVVGGRAGALVPVIQGLPAKTTEDHLKALGAAAASSGSVAMFHAVGITPEAPTLEAATGGRPLPTEQITDEHLDAAVRELSTGSAANVDAVCLGTPHFSLAEFGRLRQALAGRRAALPLYVNTGRGVLGDLQARGWDEELSALGVTIVTDTCTYLTPILADAIRTVMTDSGKWAFYAPANLGVDVVLADLDMCVNRAVAGRVGS